MKYIPVTLSILIVSFIFCSGCGDDESEAQRLSYPVVANIDSTADIGTISLMVMAGTRHDPPHSPGTAAETARIILMQDDGPGRGVTDRLQSIGADIEANAGFLSTDFRITAQPQILFEAFESFRDALLRPAFALQKSDCPRQSVTIDRSVFRSSASALVHNLITGRESISTDTAVSERAEIAAESLTDFHRRYYCRDNIAVGVSGNVPDSLHSFIITAFDSLRAKADGTGLETEFAVEDTTVVLIERQPNSVSSFAIGIPIELDRNDFYPALAAAHYIGGSIARSGILSKELVFERSIAEHVTGKLYPANSGPTTNGIIDLVSGRKCIFMVESATIEGNLEFAIKLCLESIKEVARNGLPSEDIDRIKRYIVNSFPLRMDSPLSKTECMLDEILIEDPEFIERFESEILTVTDSAVNAALNIAFSNAPYIVAAEVQNPQDFRSSLLDNKIDVDYDPAVDRDPLRYRDIRISQSSIVTSSKQVMIRERK